MEANHLRDPKETDMAESADPSQSPARPERPSGRILRHVRDELARVRGKVLGACAACAAGACRPELHALQWAHGPLAFARSQRARSRQSQRRAREPRRRRAGWRWLQSIHPRRRLPQGCEAQPRRGATPAREHVLAAALDFCLTCVASRHGRDQARLLAARRQGSAGHPGSQRRSSRRIVNAMHP